MGELLAPGFVSSAYAAARNAAAFRQRHEQGVIRVTGADRRPWLNGLLTNDVINQATCYAAWLTPQGRMITDMFVVSSDADTMLEVPAPLSKSLTARLDGMIFAEDVRVEDWSARILPIEIIGPDADAALDALRHAVDDGLHVRAVVTPPSGVVAYVQQAQVHGALESLAHAGARPLDDETAEVLRIEAGSPRFLVDMNEETIPLEAGLDAAISHTKGCYVGQEIIVRIRDRAHGRVARHLVGLLIDGDAVAPADQPVLIGGRQVGRLTSAARSVALGRPIALALLHRDASATGTPVALATGETATVTSLPFVTTRQVQT